MRDFQIGDKVICRVPGSWVDGKLGTVKRLFVRTSDDIYGHQLQMDRCVTVIPPDALELHSEDK